MGFLNAVKGFLNIGGVSVKLQGVSQRVSRSGNQINGNVVLSSKGDKLVLKLTYRFYMTLTRKKSGSENETETKDLTIAEIIHPEQFDMKEGETKTIPFTIPYTLEQRLQDRGGFLGAMGKLGAMVSDDKEEYYVSALCDVKGTALDPSDRIEVVLVD